MAAIPADTAYCVKHGWVFITGPAEIIPGKWVPLCSVCYALEVGKQL